MHVVCTTTSHTRQKTHLVSSGSGSSGSLCLKLHLGHINPSLPSIMGSALPFLPTSPFLGTGAKSPSSISISESDDSTLWHCLRFTFLGDRAFLCRGFSETEPFFVLTFPLFTGCGFTFLTIKIYISVFVSILNEFHAFRGSIQERRRPGSWAPLGLVQLGHRSYLF